MNLFRCRTSRVLGRLAGSAIVLESSSDVYSKRFVGTLRATPGGTCIDYFWKKGAGHCVYGDGAFDEEEILSFLAEWLEAQQLESPG